MPVVRSISGLRATVKDGLTPQLVIEYSSAFAMLQPYGEIVVGNDGRPTGKWIENLVIGTLTASGRKVRAIGTVPTPTVQLEVEHSDAVGGIAITASHNPGEWNGLKFLDSNGVFLNKEQNEKLWDILDSKQFEYSDETKPHKVFYDELALKKHVDSVFATPILRNQNIVNKIKNRKLKVVVDAVNASGSLIVPKLLEQLDCEIVYLYCDESGVFPHTPEPLPINLTELADNVKIHNADLGIAVDPDADRLVLIDENGEPIGEEKTIVLAARSVFENFNLFKGFEKIAVVNLSTSRMIEDVAENYGFKVVRSAVGEINVVDKMKEVNAVVGGEGSGGVILPACHYGRDSLVGIALVLSLMAQKEKSLSELASDIPEYAMLKLKKEYSGDIKAIFSSIEKKYNNFKPVKTDGLRFDFNDEWVQIRASNTEPIIRVIAESKNSERAEQLANDFIILF